MFTLCIITSLRTLKMKYVFLIFCQITDMRTDFYSYFTLHYTAENLITDILLLISITVFIAHFPIYE